VLGLVRAAEWADAFNCVVVALVIFFCSYFFTIDYYVTYSYSPSFFSVCRSLPILCASDVFALLCSSDFAAQGLG